MKKYLEISHSKILIEQGEFADGVAVVFIPGMSGGAHSERFDGVATCIHAAGHTSIRLEAWSGESDIKTKTLRHLYTQVEEVVTYVLHSGFEEVVLIGKSFGGGIALAYEHPQITKKILWAPAIGVAETENISSLLDVPLSEISQALDIHMSTEDLATEEAHVCIIHGDADTVIPLENSEKIIKNVPHGILRSMSDADHSFKNPAHEKEVLRITEEFLRDVV